MFTNSVKTLQEKSKNIINVFTKTIDELNEVNVKVAKLTTEKEETVSKLQNDISMLSTLCQNNLNIVKKISRMIEPESEPETESEFEPDSN